MAVLKWGTIPTCFSLERKHRLIKRFAKAVLNTENYATTIYRETINHELARLRQPDIFKSGVSLVDKHNPSQKTSRFLCDYFMTNLVKDPLEPLGFLGPLVVVVVV